VNSSVSRESALRRLQRLRLEARGLVQGVGFRPHALRVARALDLGGHVLNHGDGVTIEVEGAAADAFAQRLRDTLPPLARLDSLTIEAIPVRGDRAFTIEHSARGCGDALVPADAAICAACRDELFDPGNRRYLHPFIACSDCGPRFTMSRRLPYDRVHTTMADFPMCDACAAEYEDPAGRRLHAEPIACHACGPTLSVPVADIAACLRAGGIVAIKGIGGFHLACDARNARVVQRLRTQKRRDGRPLAVMVLNQRSAADLVQLDASQDQLLTSPQRPVLIAERRPTCALPDALAPGLPSLGVLLPYTGLHYLLFHELAGRPSGTAWLDAPCSITLVMTSANRSGDPILTDNDEAGVALEDIADLVVSHTREIARGCEDSVLRGTPSGPIVVRRGRGFTPEGVTLSREQAPVLALGALLKATVCVTRRREAFLSPHLGDLESVGMHRLLATSSEDLLDWLRVEPEAIACDLHPDYASTRLGEHLAEAFDVPLIRVQHHHAHIASVLAARGHDGPALGLALDGHGLGTDGGSWGGELLHVDGAAMKRLGHLSHIPLPGGDRATREPWRIAVTLAESLGRAADLDLDPARAPLRDAIVMLGESPACQRSTACGRYFDAAAAILGLCDEACFEAEAPMRLEAHCVNPAADPDLYRLDEDGLDLYPLLDRLFKVRGARAGAELFHGTLIEALTAWVADAARRSGIRTIALSGGCFLNSHLARALPQRLAGEGLEVLSAWDRLTPGDGSIALGQAWAAGDVLRRGLDHCSYANTVAGGEMS